MKIVVVSVRCRNRVIRMSSGRITRQVPPLSARRRRPCQGEAARKVAMRSSRALRGSPGRGAHGAAGAGGGGLRPGLAGLRHPQARAVPHQHRQEPGGNRGAGGLDDAVLARLARALLRVGAGLPLFGGRLFGGRRLALLRLLPGVGFVFRQAGGAVAEDEARGLPRIRLGGLGAPVEPGEEAGDPEGEERRP